MFKRFKIKKQMKQVKKKIAAVEQRRIRSQATLIDAILKQTTPDDKDVDYFNMFTGQINELREELHKLEDQYNSMK